MTRPPATVNAPGLDPPRAALAFIFVAALATRLGLCLAYTPRFGADSMSYVSRAQQLVEGGPLAVLRLPIEHSPLYSVFLLPAVLLGLDPGWYSILAQAVLGSMTAVLVARITARATRSQLTGVLAGLIAAAHLTFVFWGTYVLSDSLFVFVLAVAADRLLALTWSPRPFVDGVVAGVALLVSAASRPTAALFVGAIVLFLAIAAGGDRRRFLQMLAGCAGPVVLVAIVWATLAFLGRAPSPIATIEHAADWGRSAVYVGIIWTEEGRATAGVDVGVHPPPAVGRMSEAQRDAFWRLNTDRQPFDFIAAQPAWFMQQLARKAAFFWTPVLPEYSSTHRLVRFIYFLPLYTLALIGLLTTARSRPAFAALMAYGVATFTVTCLLTFVDYDQRYRLPVELFLIPLAGAGLTWLWSRRPAASRLVVRSTSSRIASDRLGARGQ